MKNLPELLELAESGPKDERDRRVSMIRTFNTLFKSVIGLAGQLEKVQLFGAATWLVADSRVIAETVQTMMSTARDFQYRCRKLMNDNESGQRSRSSSTTANPGQALTAYMKAAHINTSEMALLMKIPPHHLSEILANRRAITVYGAKMLEEATGSSAESWLTLQMLYSLCNSEEVPVAIASGLRERFNRRSI